jgi:ABC-2 type transport system ATP-binding protein
MLTAWMWEMTDGVKIEIFGNGLCYNSGNKLQLGGKSMNAIEISELTKKYKDITAVDHLNLQIREGELLSLLGVNGAGKTTTVKMLSCLTQPTSGDAFLKGKSICKEPAAVKALIAVSPQETAVAPGLTVYENLALICGVHGFSGDVAREKVAEMMGLLGLEPISSQKAGKLSGGWQRRLSIAMALISGPEILFLDEPTLGLDVLARHELWETVRGLKGDVTVILTTHYMEEAEALSDRIGIMKDGKLLAVGTAEDLKTRAGTDNFEKAFVAIVKEDGV